jgi:hypothetical protein
VKIAAVMLAALAACGCGYIGSPQPPLVNVPARITDLGAVEHASEIVVTFTVPHETTEGNILKQPIHLDLRIGAAGNDWAQRAKPVPAVAVEKGKGQTEIPAADWIGKDVTIGARVIGTNRKPSAWATYNLKVVSPPERPADLHAVATAQGVHLTWDGGEGTFRVYRRVGEAPDFSLAAEVDHREWTDTGSEFGATYAYRVQRVAKTDEHQEAQSALSDEVSITPKDTFPPAVPKGLNASIAPNSIEVTWEQNTEPDLAGYRLYRAAAGGAFEKIADVSQIPAYSDQMVEHGKTYRYEVSAVDRAGNESERSAPVEATLP